MRLWMLESWQGTVRVRSWHSWQRQGTLSEIFDFLTWFSTRSLSLERRLSFWLWTLCTAQPTSHVRAARENTKCKSRTKFRDLENQGHSMSPTQTPNTNIMGFVGEDVRGGGAATTWQECSTHCISMSGRHSNICSEVPANTKLPLPKFSNNDLRLLWNVSHIPVTWLCKLCKNVVLFWHPKKKKNLWRSPILHKLFAHLKGGDKWQCLGK